MTKQPSTSLHRFHLPKQGVLKPNGSDDPLPYYYRPLIGKIYRARIEQALSLLTPPYESILEMGYGSGILLPSLRQMSDRLSGIDLNSIPQIVGENLEEIGVSCSLVQGDVANSCFPEGSFDLIVAISIFEHIHDLTPVLESLLQNSINAVIAGNAVTKKSRNLLI